jgi:DNA-binding transcriptional LysR family regulator
VPAAQPLARGEFIDIADLHGQRWIGGPGGDRVMGVWPGLDERPEIAHTARNWLAKLRLVAADCGLTTVPAALAPAAPAGICILPVRGGPAEQRRILLARLPQPLSGPAARLADALHAAAIETDPPVKGGTLPIRS